MPESLNVLLIADKENEAVLILKELRQGGFNPWCKLARTAQELSQALASRPWDVVVSKDRLDGFSALEALALVRAGGGGDIPFIVVSGAVELQLVHDLLKAGIHEHLTMESLNRLGDAVRREIQTAELKASRERYRLLLHNANDAVFVHEISPEAPGRFIEVNEQASRMLGYTAEEFLSMSVSDIDVPEQKERIPAIIESLFKTGHALFQTEYVAKDGRRISVEISTRAFEFKGRPTVLSIARDISDRKRAEQELSESFDRLRKAMRGIIQVIAQTVETRDPYTAGHQRRVSDLARAIAREMGLSKDRIDGIRTTSLIHDLGKVAIPAEILSKPAKLNPLEYELVKTHSRVGYDILKEVEFPWPVAEMILQHHERLDGSGYPRGLKGDQIILEARILMVADVVEAMATHRPFRPALKLETALAEIVNNRGRLYDDAVVDACLAAFQIRGFIFKA